ncbi:MAG: 2-isopropylmalate synthase, partial [Pseudomonadota bacterium]
YANGDVYEGSFVAGRRQGPGTMRYATGRVETGDWTAGALADGEGTAEVETVTPTVDADPVPTGNDG